MVAKIEKIPEEGSAKSGEFLELVKGFEDIMGSWDDSPEDNLDFFYVPSIKLNVSKQRIWQPNRVEAHKSLQAQGNRMITLPEFVEVLKYTRENLPEVYKDITEVRSPDRQEVIDAIFEVKDGELYVNSNHVLDSDGNLNAKYSRPLSRDTLREFSHISLEDWVQNPTKQGLPTKKTKVGSLFYSPPTDMWWTSAAFFYCDEGGNHLDFGEDSCHGEARAVRDE